MLSDPSGFIDIGSTLTDMPSFLAFARVPATGWSLGLVIPRDEILWEVVSLYRTQVIVTALILVAMLVVATILARSITRPLRDMVAATGRIAEGNLDVVLPGTESEDEIGVLAKAFEHMTVDLKKYIRDLTEATAAKERIESELAIAARIQRSMLPTIFPAYPEREDFDIYAVMEPAKLVGGDFYDFFLIDDDHLCLAVGDVADKGVPASLFMAVTIFLIHAAASRGEPPHEILSLLNEQMCPGNDSCTFVTVFCGIIDLRTGQIAFSNAGHEPPLLTGGGAAAEEFPVPGAPALGIKQDAEFMTESMILSPQQTIFAYTDGVTDALNECQEMYSENRLKRTIDSIYRGDPKAPVGEVLRDLEQFRHGAEQFDDITLLAFTYCRKPTD